MAKFIILIMAVLLVGCVPEPDSRVTFSKPGSGESPKVSREALIGSWYGLQPTKDGTTKEWITRRLPDGSFQAHFREIENGCIVSESNEVGKWGLSYDLEVVITRGWLEGGSFRPASANAYFWDLYRIEHVDRDGMVYIHYGTGHRYSVHRVADDFTFPEEPSQSPQGTSAKAPSSLTEPEGPRS